MTHDIIWSAIESFINSDDVRGELYWLRLYYIIPQLIEEEINKILFLKKEKQIQLEREFEEEE